MKESDIQRAILDYLTARMIFHRRIKVTGFKIGENHWIKSGMEGISDIIACHEGRTYAIEVKTAKGKLSPAQKEFLESVELHGDWTTIVARSVEDVMRYFES